MILRKDSSFGSRHYHVINETPIAFFFNCIQHSYGEALVQSGQIAAAPEESMSGPLVEDNSTNK
ncbi:hypothetical protein Sjap_010652 [Stephania japonica]|uniref:Uncharacterized protein n=1 Tax=Stephania japonica TaxID=461633 RepID=A0AAP0P6M6_9MAGN